MKEKIKKLYNDGMAHWVGYPYWMRACFWVAVGFVAGAIIL